MIFMEVGLVEIGAGNPGAAMETERMIQHFGADVALFAAWRAASRM